jgi:hypothetical protein
VVFIEEDEELMRLVDLVDEYLLEEVVGETDYFQRLGAAELQGGQLAVGDPLLRCLD